MNEHIRTAIEAVRAEFLPAEQAADMAAARTARLLATTLERRADAGLAFGTGVALIRKLSQSLSAQIEARESYVMAHKLAAEIPASLGLEETMFGDLSPCPPDTQRTFFGQSENVVALRAG